MNRAVAARLGNANDVVTCISQGLSVAVHDLRIDRIERSVLRIELSDNCCLKRNNCHEHVDVIDDPALPDGELRIRPERFEYDDPFAIEEGAVNGVELLLGVLPTMSAAEIIEGERVPPHVQAGAQPVCLQI